TGVTPTSDAQTVLVCQDGGFSDGGIDDSGDALPGLPIDGGCVVENVTGGGTTSDGGTSGSGTCTSNGMTIPNPSSVIVSGGGTTTVDEAGVSTSTGGTQVVIDPKYICAKLGGGTATNATVSGLINDVQYTIAVAASDGYGNIGPLSTPTCSSPTLVDDFWKTYRNSGGQAGGGFCALEGAGMPVGSSVFGLSGLVAALSLVRRRMKK
ncbi:MAG: hypothetical protein ABIP39_09130, partial [Polyangiaceae bacterium]